MASRKDQAVETEEKTYCEGSDIFADNFKFVGDKQVQCPKCGKGVTIKGNGKLRTHVPGDGLPEESEEEETNEPVVVYDFNKASKRASPEEALQKHLVAPKYGEPILRPLLSKGMSVRIVRGQKNLIGKIGFVHEYDRGWGHVTFKDKEGTSFGINDWDVEEFNDEADKKL